MRKRCAGDIRVAIIGLPDDPNSWIRADINTFITPGSAKTKGVQGADVLLISGGGRDLPLQVAVIININNERMGTWCVKKGDYIQSGYYQTPTSPQ